MSQVRIIKKYPNRRLYDMEISSYVTLEDVRQLIVEGESFEVRDARTGKDLTRAVLLQILAEHEDIGLPIFSTQLLTTVDPLLRRFAAGDHRQLPGAQHPGVQRTAAAAARTDRQPGRAGAPVAAQPAGRTQHGNLEGTCSRESRAACRPPPRSPTRSRRPGPGPASASPANDQPASRWLPAASAESARRSVAAWPPRDTG